MERSAKRRTDRRRRRLAWVSPLTPVARGMAEYATDLLPFLSERFDIDLIASDTQQMLVSEALSRNHLILTAQEVPSRHAAQPYDLFVYQLSSARPHLYMLELLHRFPGLVVLHDPSVADLNRLAEINLLCPRDAADDERYEYRARQGIPSPFVELRARGDDGELIPADDKTMGELEVRGPWIAAAYHHGQGAEKFTSDGWFQTGDIVQIDGRGCIRICDRAKDLVKSGGEWISSVDLENVLMAHPAVAEAAVIAIPDERWGERPMAVVVLREGQEAGPEDLRKHLSQRFSKWQLPERVEFVEEIPRTATGKFKKLELRERFVTAAVS